MANDNHADGTADYNPFSDLTKTFEQFNVPGVDMTTFVEARRKDVEALAKANQITCDALQALAKAQTDMLTRAMQGMQESAKTAVAGTGDAASQGEAAQHAWRKMVADMTHLASIAQRAQVQAVKGLTERANESVGEMKALVRVK